MPEELISCVDCGKQFKDGEYGFLVYRYPSPVGVWMHVQHVLTTTRP